MDIGGINKSSLIDYPGKVGCVLFTSGCNFKCPYCHNPELVRPARPSHTFHDQNKIFEFLERRKGLLDGVVISGGEPTLQRDIVSFLKKIKKIGYPIKLDTNGSRPQVIRLLISEGLIDYIAMDIKTLPQLYIPEIAETLDVGKIVASVRLIMNSDLPYEFRTTCVSPFIDSRLISGISNLIEGAKLYVLQRYKYRKVLRPEFFEDVDRKILDNELDHYLGIAENFVKKCIIR